MCVVGGSLPQPAHSRDYITIITVVIVNAYESGHIDDDDDDDDDDNDVLCSKCTYKYTYVYVMYMYMYMYT